MFPLSYITHTSVHLIYLAYCTAYIIQYIIHYISYLSIILYISITPLITSSNRWLFLYCKHFTLNYVFTYWPYINPIFLTRQFITKNVAGFNWPDIYLLRKGVTSYCVVYASWSIKMIKTHKVHYKTDIVVDIGLLCDNTKQYNNWKQN